MGEYRKVIETTEELGKWYDKKYLEMGDGWNTPAEEVNRHLDDLGVPYDRTKTLLDVGCGAGHFLLEAQKRVTAEGLEISEEAIKYAYKRGVLAGTIGFVSVENLSVSLLNRYDYIVSIGSLEHIVHLDRALIRIREALKPDGKFYFYCPNELWKHFDQPNERTMTDDEWVKLFEDRGLYVKSMKRWNDNTAFTGDKQGPKSWTVPEKYWEAKAVCAVPVGNKLNIGSGQRRFDNAHGWINIDCVLRVPDQVPDLICDVGRDPLPFEDNSMDVCVLHQVYEHFGLGEGHGVVREAHRVLKPGGSLIVTVPFAKRLAERRALGQIDNYIFSVNMMGAFQGLESDRHRWCFWDLDALKEDIQKSEVAWTSMKYFDGRAIEGSNIAMSWWILALECVR